MFQNHADLYEWTMVTVAFPIHHRAHSYRLLWLIINLDSTIWIRFAGYLSWSHWFRSILWLDTILSIPDFSVDVRYYIDLTINSCCRQNVSSDLARDVLNRSKIVDITVSLFDLWCLKCDTFVFLIPRVIATLLKWFVNFGLWIFVHIFLIYQCFNGTFCIHSFNITIAF